MSTSVAPVKTFDDSVGNMKWDVGACNYAPPGSPLPTHYFHTDHLGSVTPITNESP